MAFLETQDSYNILLLTRKYFQADIRASRVKSLPASGGVVDGSPASASGRHPFLRFGANVRSAGAASSMPSVASILRPVPLVELFVQPVAGHVLRRGPVPFRGVRETCRWSNDLFRDLGVEQHDGTHDREKR